MKFAAVLLVSSLFVPVLKAAPNDTSKTQIVLQNYSQLVYDSYSEAYSTAAKLQSAVDQLLVNPSAKSLEEAKQAWLESRIAYGRTEVFRFYEGPIDDANSGVEGLINAWPLDEAYIDSVVGQENAGIINDTASFPVITEELLISLNESGSETNVATGFHAIEFLLWGQDLSTTGPGARPYSDYVIGVGKNALRRGIYLQIASNLLVKQIGMVRDAWNPADLNSYGVQFSKQAPAVALTQAFKGMSTLLTDELAGERMYTGYESQLQEDEHSCFSDNTHSDIIENIRGVIQVWTGDFNDNVAVGFDELVEPALARQVSQQLNFALAAALSLPRPYDSLLLAPEGSEERQQLLDAILAVLNAGTAVKEAAESIGIALPTN